MIPRGWSESTLGAIASSQYGLVDGPFGSALPASEYVSHGIPVIRGNNLSLGTDRFIDGGFVWVSGSTAARLARSLCGPGDIIFTKKGTLGQTGYIPQSARFERYLLSSNQMKLTVDPRMADALYVYYYVSAPSSRERIIRDSSVTGVPKTNVTYLRGFPILLPPLPAQHKIAAILSAYNDLIDNNNHRIRILEEMAQRIYREWLVEFHYPGRENLRLAGSELGPIPDGWSVQRLGEVIELVYGKALKADARRGGTVAVFGSGGVIGHHDVRLAKGPGVIVGRKGNVGTVYWSDSDFYAIDTTYWVRSRLPLTYCYFTLRGMKFLDSHAAVPGLSRDQAYSLPLIVPDADTLIAFNSAALELFTLRRCLEDAISNLRATRDLLLPRLISGEIDVTGLDIPMPEAVA